MPERIGDTSVLTTIHFAVIALLIALTLAGIVWGMRLKRQRVVAEEAAEHRVEEGEAEQRAEEAAPALDRTPPAAPAAPTSDALAPPLSPEPARSPEPLDDEPIAAAAPLAASPAMEAAPAPVDPVAEPVPAQSIAAAIPVESSGPSPADGPVTQLKGLGPKVAAMLAGHGITTVGQLATLDAAEAEAIDARLGPFTGRMARDRWIEQARFLAAGDKAGFEAVFGRL